MSKIQMTKNYRFFERHSNENRPLDLKRHKKLVESMRLYGFLACFPIVVVRRDDGVLIVKDGQHRLAIAEELGLPVFYIEEKIDFDVAVVNSTAKTWQLCDYARKHAANGLKDYQEGLEFSELHGLPLGVTFALLAGTTSFNNCMPPFIDGKYKIKDRPWAEMVAGIYGPMTQMSSDLKNARFIEACMAVCRIQAFDSKRLLAGAARCRDKMASYSTRDAYLDMMEVIYNFGRTQLFGLKIAALMALRKRSAASSSSRRASRNGAAEKPLEALV